MLREMKISGLVLDPQAEAAVVVLNDERKETSLQIWIGLLEAVAIAAELEQVHFARPMTHDLMVNVMTLLGAKVDRVEIYDLRENTFYAWIYLSINGQETKIDARPSDALAIALRMYASIHVNEKLLEESECAGSGNEVEIRDEESKKWTEILQNLSPEDFGKYKM